MELEDLLMESEVEGWRLIEFSGWRDERKTEEVGGGTVFVVSEGRE